MYDPACKKYPPVYRLNVEEIPPPPPQIQNRTGPIVVLSLVVLVLMMSVRVTGVYLKNDQSRATSAPQTFPTTYTATTPVRDFQAADLTVWTVQYGKSINEWDGGDYSVPIAFMNSAIFDDITACTGPCTPEQIGLWVYVTSADAFSAYQEIINTTPLNGGGYLGVLAAYVHGRCLVLGPSTISIQIMITKCTCIIYDRFSRDRRGTFPEFLPLVEHKSIFPDKN